MGWHLFADGDYLGIAIILWVLVAGPCVALRDYFLHLDDKDK